jgi:subfamily B ATP-binding cassette protein MsbA
MIDYLCKKIKIKDMSLNNISLYMENNWKLGILYITIIVIIVALFIYIRKKISKSKNKIKKPFDYSSNFQIYCRILREAFMPNIFKFSFATCFMLISSSTIAYRAYLIKPAVDKVFDSKNTTALIWIPIQLIIVAILSSATTILHQYLMQKTSTNVRIKYQKKLFQNLINTDIDFYSNKGSYKIMDLFNDVNSLMDAINIIFTGLIKELFSIAGLIGLMFYQNPKLAFISLIGFPAVILPFKYTTKKLKEIASQSIGMGGAVNQVMGEAFSLIELVKSTASEGKEIKKFNRIAMQNFKISMQMSVFAMMSSPIMEMAGTIGFAGVLWIGGKEVINETMTSGTFFTFVAAALSIYKPAKSFGTIGTNFQRTLLSAKRLFITLDKEPLIKDKENAIKLENVQGNVELKNVVFRYQIHDKKEALIELNPKIQFDSKVALNGINIKIEKGENIALVGHSGSGKSTIFKLIQRFYDVESGSLTIDGFNIKDVTLKSLRSNISIVSQDVLLFNETIRENIKYGTLGATNKQIMDACEMANATEFINEMSEGIETLLGPNGVVLSGGQKQRISIARAILRNSPILLLDEATSALDPISEKLIQKALHVLMKDKTTIIIAHRLSTVQNCDKIFVMQKGNVIEVGNHETLLAQNGHYAELYNKQFEKAL